MLDGGVKATAKAGKIQAGSGDNPFDGADRGLDGGDLLSAVADRFFSKTAVSAPATTHKSVSHAPSLSGSFNQTAAVAAGPSFAISQLQHVAAPPVVELRASEAAVNTTPQEVKEQATGVSATVAQAKREVQQAVAGAGPSHSSSAHKPQAATQSGGGSGGLTLGNVFTGLTVGGAVGLAADAVVPGAGAVLGVMTTAFQAAAQALHGGGTDATFMQPLGHSALGQRKSARGTGYERHAPSSAPAPSTPSLATQSILNKLSAGPGFGAKPDAGSVALAGSSLGDMKIGGMTAARYMDSLEKLDQQCQRALAASHTREEKGLVLDRSTFEQVLKRNIPLNQTNPFVVSGAAV